MEEKIIKLLTDMHSDIKDMKSDITDIKERQEKMEADITVIKEEKVGENRPGTGDIFTSIVMGSVMKHQTVISGVKKASHFVKQCIEQSERWNIPIEDGVCFEEFLYTL